MQLEQCQWNKFDYQQQQLLLLLPIHCFQDHQDVHALKTKRRIAGDFKFQDFRTRSRNWTESSRCWWFKINKTVALLHLIPIFFFHHQRWCFLSLNKRYIETGVSFSQPRPDPSHNFCWTQKSRSRIEKKRVTVKRKKKGKKRRLEIYLN